MEKTMKFSSAKLKSNGKRKVSGFYSREEGKKISISKKEHKVMPEIWVALKGKY